jgi:dCTP diphosphatase
MDKTTNQDSFEYFRQLMRDFSRDRDWEQFHDPKSLLLALVGEVGELAELFQWLPADQAQGLASKPELHQRVGEEIGDIVLYLVRLADVLDVNLGQATMSKFDSVVQRFPTESVKGQAPRKN